MSSNKRFPGWSARDITFKRARHDGAVGTEYVPPAVVQGMPEHKPLPAPASAATDFTAWTEADMKSFLDTRGEDYDDCIDFYALVQRALECEHNTGPATKPSAAAAAQQDEDDPLAAFMAGIDDTIAQQNTEKAADVSSRHLSCDDDDPMADYIAAHETATQLKIKQKTETPSGHGAGYGSDEEVYAVAQALDSEPAEQEQPAQKNVDPLPPINHAKVTYKPFKKNFYDESPELFAMDDSDIKKLLADQQIDVGGRDVPKLVSSFDQCTFDAKLAEAIASAGYTKPTAIQAQVLPAALSGRDVLGIAKTGSGKTAAFVLPMVVHVADQPRLRPGEGPIAVVLAPTRELAEQIHKEARRCCAAFGGLQKYAQTKELRAGAEIAVATPGRLIDLVRSKACDFVRTTMLVVDEVDRCFDLGFEPQVFSIVRHVRPDRQTMLFSATLPGHVRRLVREALTDEVSVTVGEVGAANADVRQSVLVMSNDAQKLQWLQANLPRFVDEGNVLVFANQKASVDTLVAVLRGWGVKADGMHGDLDQHTRMSILNSFKGGQLHVLVATDVAARGLDIRSIKTVLNYDAARDIDTHVHRIGRTGRAGDTDGAAYTLLMPHESRLAAALVSNLERVGQPVPKNLSDIAMKDKQFGKARGGRGKSAGRAVGGHGLGFASAAPARAPTPGRGPAFAPAMPPPNTQTAAQGNDVPACGAAEHTFEDSRARPEPSARRSRFSNAPPLSVEGSQGGGGRAANSEGAPHGFVSSNQFAGGMEDAPTIVMPVQSRTEAGRRDAPASWMQKRIQQGRQPARTFIPQSSASLPPPPQPPSDDPVQRAIAVAREVAARSQTANTPQPGGMSGAQPQSGRYAYTASHGSGGTGSGAGRYANAPPPDLGSNGPGGARAAMSADEARRIAQETAQRILAQAGSATASGQTADGKQWAWSKS